jgi:RecA-family ATPase
MNDSANISDGKHISGGTPLKYDTDLLKGLKEEVEKHVDTFKSLFEVQQATKAIEEAMAMPDPVQLYPYLVLQNELAVLFADTGVGKTVFAFQMAIHIANNTGLTVLFLDLELSKKQFQRRYTGLDGKPYPLPPNLYRLGFARLKKVPVNTTYEDFFFQSLIAAVDQTGAKIVFLDNLTKLAAGDTDSAKAAIPILEKLNDLKADKDLTIRT